MEDVFIRKPSGLESFFIDLDAGGCNMTFHFYLELDRKPDLAFLNATMKKMIDTHEGINMRFYRNAWYSSSYVPECRVYEVDGNDLENFRPYRLDFRTHTVALNVLHAKQSDTWYLCFDFFHGVADGLSGVQFIYNFFDLLNGRNLPEISFTASDYNLVNDNGRPRWKGKHPDFTVFPKCEPSNWNIGKDGHSKTAVLRCERSIRYAAARLSDVIGSYFSDKSAKMIIPINVRRYDDTSRGKALFGNLFVPMLLDVKSCKSWQNIHGKIIDFAKCKPRIRKMAKNLKIYSKFSTKLRQLIIKRAVPTVMSSKKFIYCALVSTLGRIDNERLKSDAFNVNDYTVTFDSFPFTAFTVITLQFKEKANTSVSWNSGRVPENIAQSLIDDIAKCLDGPMPAGC